MASKDAPNRRSAWWVLGVFWACLVFATLDRQVISIAGRAMQTDLRLSDAQLGLLQGPAFAFCAAVTGVPIGWLLDRFNRVTIASVCLLLWSATTCLTGFASTFVGLAVLRGGGALGEAGLAPAALSIFPDIYPARKIPRVSSTFLTAPFVGGGLGLVFGGLLLDVFSHTHLTVPGTGAVFRNWQLVFISVGLPGLVLAAALKWLVVDPPREARPLVGMVGGVDLEARSRTRLLAIFVAGMTFLVVIMYVQLSWLPMRFLRSFHIEPGETGLIIGATYMVGGLLGAALAGVLSSRAAPDGVLGRVLSIISISAALLVVPLVVADLAPDKWIAAGAFFLGVVLLCTALTLASSPIQLLVGSGHRARALALTTVSFNVIGGGAGPLIVGVLSDVLRERSNALGWAMAEATTGSAAIALIALLFASRRVEAGSARPLGAPGVY